MDALFFFMLVVTGVVAMLVVVLRASISPSGTGAAGEAQPTADPGLDAGWRLFGASSRSSSS